MINKMLWLNKVARKSAALFYMVSALTGAGVRATAAAPVGEVKAEQLATDEQAELAALTRDLTALKQNFTVLQKKAEGEHGERVLARMAEQIRNSPPGEDKRELTRSMFRYLEDIVVNGHPTVSAQAAVRLTAETIYHTEYRVAPAFGNEEAKAFFERALFCKDHAARAEASRWLYRAVLIEPSSSQRALDLCRKAVKGHEGDGPEAEASLRTIGRAVEALEHINWKYEERRAITEEEFIALHGLSKDELCSLLPRGDEKSRYALKALLDSGCTEDIMDRVIDAAKKMGKMGDTCLREVVSTVLEPLKAGNAKPEDVRLLNILIGKMERELHVFDSPINRCAVSALLTIVDVIHNEDLQCSAEAERAFALIVEATKHSNIFIRRDSVRAWAGQTVLKPKESSTRFVISKICLESAKRTGREALGVSRSPSGRAHMAVPDGGRDLREGSQEGTR